MRNETPTIILGIDPGYGRVGYGFIQSLKGATTCLSYGCITTSSSLSLSERLVQIADELRDLVVKGSPQLVAIEKLYFSTNTKTALDVAHARGVIILTIMQQSSATLIELSPMQVKQATVGYGGATKSQMQIMVQKLLKLKTLPTPDDAADALAIAMCASTINSTHSY